MLYYESEDYLFQYLWMIYYFILLNIKQNYAIIRYFYHEWMNMLDLFNIVHELADKTDMIEEILC